MGEIKRLSRANYDDVFALSQYAFQYRLSEKELEKKEQEADRHDIWGYYYDGELAGKLHIIPLEILIAGKRFSMGGISSVATWPEQRRSGIAKQLLHHALMKMKEQGQVVSYLHPFSAGFYRKYGWEFTVTRRHDQIPIQQFKQCWDITGYVKREAFDYAVLNNIYIHYANKFQGMLLRDELWWKQRVLTDEQLHIIVAYNNANEAEGYLIYRMQNDTFTVKELAYKNRNGKYLLYDFISNHDSMAQKVEWIVPENDLFPILINEPFYLQVAKPYFMARIVDVEEFLRQYIYRNDPQDILLSVEDEFVPENSGTYKIVTKEGRAISVERLKHQSGDVHCSVQHLAAMFLGYKRPSELSDAELIKGELMEIKKLENMLPSGQTFLADFF